MSGADHNDHTGSISKTQPETDHALLGWMQEIAPFGIFTTDHALVIRSWNTWLDAHSGLNADEVVGRKLSDVFPDLEKRGLLNRFSRALEGEINVLSTALHRYLLPFRINTDARAPEHMLQTARIAPLPEKDKIIGTITIIEDVTQREQHATVVHRQQEIDRLMSVALASLLQASNPAPEIGKILSALIVALRLDVYACYLVNSETRQLSLNSSGGILPKQQEAIAALQLTDTDLNELTRHDPGALLRSPAGLLLKSMGLRAISLLPLSVAGEPIGLIAVGSYERDRIAHVDQAVLERTAHFIATAVDRFRREQTTSAASKAKDEFLAALSHELRTPLNPVLLIASDAKDDPQFPAAAQELFAMIEKNVLLEARLIDDLLDLTRISHRKLRLDLKELDVHAIVKDAIGNIRQEAEDKQVFLDIALTASSSTMTGDPGRLQQVFWNILKNAVKFSDRSDRILIRSAVNDARHELVVTITDEGIGMEPHEITRIFAAFAQGDHAEKAHRFGGLGMGLAISHSIVGLHAGRIEASSPGRGQGSSFQVYLPLTPKTPEAQAPASPAPSSKTASSVKGSSQKILLVEDHDSTRQALVSLLTQRGYKVSAVATMREALRAAADVSFDLVLSDIGLPDGDGNELMQQLSAKYQLRGIAITGFGMDADIRQSQQSGFTTHLVKPVNAEKLTQAIAAALAAPAAGG